MLTDAQWLDLAKAVLAPLGTGVVGVGSVLLTQRLQRDHDAKKLRTDVQRETLKDRSRYLKEILDRVFEVESIFNRAREAKSAHLAMIKSSDEAIQLAKECAQAGDPLDLAREIIAMHVSETADRRRIADNRMLELLKVFAAVVAAAEGVGPLPDELAIDGKTDLAWETHVWGWQSIRAVDDPASELDEIIGTQNDVVRACRAYRACIQAELDLLSDGGSVGKVAPGKLSAKALKHPGL